MYASTSFELSYSFQVRHKPHDVALSCVCTTSQALPAGACVEGIATLRSIISPRICQTIYPFSNSVLSSYYTLIPWVLDIFIKVLTLIGSWSVNLCR
jgi:hypothetical protein